jgi:sulfite reductase (NADPH) hemoprotein beta-component
MYFGGDGMAGGSLAIKGPSVPTARIEAAVERVTSAFESERAPDEAFFAWTRRAGKEYFANLLADLTEVKPEELPSVLRDHGKDGDFKVLQLGGGECAGVSQVKIGSSFFDAAHERNYRDALKFQRKFEESVKCAEEIARLISQGVAELLGGAKHDDLAAQAEELGRMLPTKPQLSRQLTKFAENFSRPSGEFDDAKLTEWFSELDAWTMEAAEFCLGFDRQLDLAGALPLKAVARSPLHRAQPSAVA